MRKVPSLPLSSAIAVSVLSLACARFAINSKSLLTPLTARDMRAIIGGQGAKWQCDQYTKCPYWGCPEPPGIYGTWDDYSVCKYTGNAAHYCQNNVEYICNVDHFHDNPCVNYWHLDVWNVNRCLST